MRRASVRPAWPPSAETTGVGRKLRNREACRSGTSCCCWRYARVLGGGARPARTIDGPITFPSRPGTAQEARKCLIPKCLYARDCLAFEWREKPSPKPPQATMKPPQGLLVANRLRPTSHPHATPMRPSCDPKATPKPQWMGRKRRSGPRSIWLRSGRATLDQLRPVGFQETFHGVDRLIWVLRIWRTSLSIL